MNYRIGTKCMLCGTCVELCSAGAIEQDSMGNLHIRQEVCLGCGECAECCPINAIEPA